MTPFLGRRFAETVAGVLAANGIRVYLVNEAAPTPAVAFGVKHFAASGAVMITASHNPPEYNGIKYIPDYAGPAAPQITGRLEELIRAVQEAGGVRDIPLEEAKARRLLQVIVLRPHYEAHLRRMVHLDVLKQSPLRVVIDPMHGAGIGYVSGLLGEAGVETVSIRETADPFFGGSLPEPNDHHLSLLKREVVDRQADLGLANDGDADRFGAVDRFGRYVPPNAVLALLTRHLVKNRRMRGRIVRTVATTHLLDRMRPVRSGPGGDARRVQVHRRPDAAGDVLIGGEESGGASILGHIPEKDGILINLLLAEMCAWEKKGIDQILQEVCDEFGELFSTRLDIRLSEKDRWMQQMLAVPPGQVGPFAVREINRMDGIKLLLDGGHWVLIRPSGTEPLIRIYCEAANAAALEKIREAVQDWFIEINA
ncbi:phosphoglucomutase/phosphomannomutase family protein [Brevibacillus thermoruber]|uniref:phosphoglucomutase/phosphomannomutase family protein n=1 Tax=Brevibacillus thermoruber TaxID=33942 RepID=UPI000A8C44B9|nr:phosphoglucomutase/phosphomannomutase family protein [Brevibacillus thermoruber]